MMLVDVRAGPRYFLFGKSFPGNYFEIQEFFPQSQGFLAYLRVVEGEKTFGLAFFCRKRFYFLFGLVQVRPDFFHAFMFVIAQDFLEPEMGGRYIQSYVFRGDQLRGISSVHPGAYSITIDQHAGYSATQNTDKQIYPEKRNYGFCFVFHKPFGYDFSPRSMAGGIGYSKRFIISEEVFFFKTRFSIL
ncbi:MAG: hypothetical protein ACE5G9_05440 [Nitrospinales bacterium]